MSARIDKHPRTPLAARGFTLVELMIALLLGLLLVGGALTVFISNRQTYDVAENLGRVQEGARVAFELMSRDLREAGGNPCEASIVQYNVLTNANAVWWSPPPQSPASSSFVFGYEGAVEAPGAAFGADEEARVNGTDALQLMSAVSRGIQVRAHDPVTGAFTTNIAAHGFTAGDIALVCDFGTISMFQVSSVAASTVNHALAGVVPGNSRLRLTTAGADYKFGCFLGTSEAADPTVCKETRQWPAFLAEVRASLWYVGNNGRGGRALYRAALENDAGEAEVRPLMVVDNVDDMQIHYRVGPQYIEADEVTAAQWPRVDAVRIDLTILSPTAISPGGGPFERRYRNTVAVRSRLP